MICYYHNMLNEIAYIILIAGVLYKLLIRRFGFQFHISLTNSYDIQQ